MGMNPAKFFMLKNIWDRFSSNHPKFQKFLNAVVRSPIREGTILEVKIIYPDGESIASNIRVTKEDMELYAQMKDIASRE